MFYATDAVALGDVRVGDGGYLEAFAKTVRTGCQTYLGSEVGKPEMPIVTVYRDEREVFSKDSLESFRLIPVTVDHPPGGVNAKNWRQVARGTTGAEVLRDGEYLRLGLRVKDEDAVAAVQAGKCQLSAGYRCELEWGDGVAPDGTKFQARQVGIVADHIAIVSAGRAGPQCRIGDSWSAFIGDARTPADDTQRTPPPNRDTPMKTHMIGDNAVEMSDAAIVAVKGLQTEMGRLTADNLKLTADLNTSTAAHATAMQAKDAEIADAKKAGETKDGEIAALKKQLDDAKLTPQKLDDAVKARVAVMADAEKVVGKGKITFDGKTEADIRREAVTAHLGDAAKALSDEAVNGAFLSYASKAPTLDHLGRSISASVPAPGQVIGDASTAAYDEMCRSYDGAWKRPTHQPQGNA